MKSIENYSLLPHNTFGIDARARLFVEYDSVDELRTLINDHVIGAGVRSMHIGAGSNLLFVKDYDGVVLHSNMRALSVVDEDNTTVRVRVENGMIWDEFCAEMAERGYWGVENLSYIPGEVGSAAVQNIGAYGVEFCDVAESLELISIATGEVMTVSTSQCEYNYRDSMFKHERGREFIILSVIFCLSKQPVRKLHYGNLAEHIASDASIADIRRGVIDVRRDKLPEPSEFGSAGSFFKNPVVSVEKYEALRADYPDIPSYTVGDSSKKIPAAWLIDQCGMKGTVCGGAQVYVKQPLVIVNTGGATADDVVQLAQQVTTAVDVRFGIELEREVIYVE